MGILWEEGLVVEVGDSGVKGARVEGWRVGGHPGNYPPCGTEWLDPLIENKEMVTAEVESATVSPIHNHYQTPPQEAAALL